MGTKESFAGKNYNYKVIKCLLAKVHVLRIHGYFRPSVNGERSSLQPDGVVSHVPAEDDDNQSKLKR